MGDINALNMKELTLADIKEKYDKTHTLSDSEMVLNIPCTLKSSTVSSITSCQDGKIILFKDMIDSYDTFVENLENYMKFNYVMSDGDGNTNYKLKFCLRKVNVKNIKCKDFDNTFLFCATLVMPELHGLSFPTDEGDGKFKRVVDWSGDHHFGPDGKKVGFVCSPNSTTVEKTYSVIDRESATNPKIKFPGETEVKRPGKPLMYGWCVNNDTMFKGSEYPKQFRFFNSTGVKHDCRVMLPESSFMSEWHKHGKDNDYCAKDKDIIHIPVQPHAKAAYIFADNFYHHRATTFESSGLLIHIVQATVEKTPIKFILEIVIEPIVPKSETKAIIPYANYTASLLEQLPIEKNNL